MEDGFSSYSSLYDTSSLLQFCNDDSASACSSMEVTDRIAALEQRVQMQEDEIQLLKSALADVVRRLNMSEEQQALGTRRGPTKARPMIATLPVRPTVNNGTVLPKKGSGLPSPSGSGTRKDSGAPASKSTVRRANSNEHVSSLTRKDSGDSKGNRTRAGSTGSNSSGKRSDSKQREPVFNTEQVLNTLKTGRSRTAPSEISQRSESTPASGLTYKSCLFTNVSHRRHVMMGKSSELSQTSALTLL